MNHTTKPEREAILSRARELIKMDAETRVTNTGEVEAQLKAEFGISRERVRTAVAKAARQMRHPDWGGPRPGQGRKPQNAENMVKISVLVRTDQREYLDQQDNPSATVRGAIDMCMRAEGIDV